MYSFVDLEIAKKNSPDEQMEKLNEEFEEVFEAFYLGYKKELIIDEILDLMQSCHSLLLSMGLTKNEILEANISNRIKVSTKYGSDEK